MIIVLLINKYIDKLFFKIYRYRDNLKIKIKHATTNKNETKKGAAIWLGSWEGDGWRKTELSGEPWETFTYVRQWKPFGSCDNDDIMMISV